MKFHNLLLTLAFPLVLMTSACGTDANDPEAWTDMMCNKYDDCGVLAQMMGLLGNNASECKDMMEKAGDEYNPDPSTEVGCENVDVDACFKAYESMSCEELTTSQDGPAACQCK